MEKANKNTLVPRLTIIIGSEKTVVNRNYRLSNVGNTALRLAEIRGRVIS
jgi:hypothetical protein